MRRYGSPIARLRARSRAAEHPKMAARAASAARAVPRRRIKRCHGAQARPRGASLAPLPPQCPLAPPWCVNAALRLADRATARAFARRRTPQNGRAGGLGSARGAAEAQKKVPRSPGATQRRQFRSHTTPSARWAHRGASMRRHGSPIARRRERSRAAEHPKMAARAASAARAGVAEAEKVPPTPNATQGRKLRSPIAPSAPWGRPGA